MDYIPAWDNGACFPPTKSESIRIRSFTTHVLRECISPDASDETLIGFFPGRCFYGVFLDPASANEIRQSLDVLRAIRNAHELLKGGSNLIDEEDAVAEARASRILEVMNEASGMNVQLGRGYCDELNPEGSIPQCHILHCEISMPSNYFRWTKARVEAYEGAAQLFRAESVYYLNVANNIATEETAFGGMVTIDVYGALSLLPDWDDWFNLRAEDLPSPGPSGLETIAGLLHLADTLATIHLVTSVPIVDHCSLWRPTAGDSLTDFWLKMYDASGNDDYVVGRFEVCDRLFVGISKNKRGHKACLNRQRVKLSRAKKYAKLIKAGVSPEEASKRASISTETATALLRDLNLF